MSADYDWRRHSVKPTKRVQLESPSRGGDREIDVNEQRVIGSVAFLFALTWASQAPAQFGVGTTWVRTDTHGKGITMTVAACCNGGLRLIDQIPVPNQPAMTLTVNSPMDGTEAPALVGGKPPSGETMAIKRLDDHRYTAVLKMNGAALRRGSGNRRG